MYVAANQLRRESNLGMDDDDLELAEGRGKSAAPPVDATEHAMEKPLIQELTEGNVTGEAVNLENRRKMIVAKSFEPAEFAFERAIGKNDSLYSNFVELLALTKRKVGRIVVMEGKKKTGFATGFMVSDCLLLTNWHVFRDAQMAAESEVHFFYEYDVQGHPQAPVVFRFDTAHFFNNELLDYCFVGIQPKDISGQVPLSSIGYLYLDSVPGKIGEKGVEMLNIIHHPQGLLKQVSIRENQFDGVDETKIFYLTDTAPGSSGSPVFNDQWQVVGLHHKSVAKMSADGKDFLDDNGEVIPVVNNTIDDSRIVWVRNEGMRISVILAHLNSKNPGNEAVASLAIPPPLESFRFSTEKDAALGTTIDRTIASDPKNITIHIPTDALAAGRTIEFSMSAKNIGTEVAVPVAVDTDAVPIGNDRMDELLLEVSKVQQAQEVDFSDCKGYDPKFLGTAIPLPKPTAAIAGQVARLKDNSMELKYHKYSVIFNALTHMPMVSGVNVEGDAEKRLDDSKRKDSWLKDARIDMDCQLADQFYARSHFDKGHMTRLEDANWGATEAEAFRNGKFTLFFTNACPQVGGFNRGVGIWGQLEKAILEKGVKKEYGALARMSVFNGPIFDAKQDRVFKGTCIPSAFFKVIVWLNDANKLRATAFKLVQDFKDSGVNFDESMRVGEEALDIDANVEFQHFQCSIKEIAKLTKLDFKKLETFDTFKAKKPGAKANILLGTESLVL